jgi:hypothetical protein
MKLRHHFGATRRFLAREQTQKNKEQARINPVFMRACSLSLNCPAQKHCSGVTRKNTIFYFTRR